MHTSHHICCSLSIHRKVCPSLSFVQYKWHQYLLYVLYLESERIWMCPLRHWLEPTATALRCDTNKSVVNRCITLCFLIHFLSPCLQELVNLLVCGRAVPNVFDNDIELDSGKGNVTLLKGIKSNCDVGLLSLFEHYNICKVNNETWAVTPGACFKKHAQQNVGGLGAQQLCQILCLFAVLYVFFSYLTSPAFQVGAYLKTPRYPIWLVCSESHFSVLFGLQRELLTSQDQSLQFDLYYYDGLANQQEEIRLTVCKSDPLLMISFMFCLQSRPVSFNVFQTLTHIFGNYHWIVQITCYLFQSWCLNSTLQIQCAKAKMLLDLFCVFSCW